MQRFEYHINCISANANDIRDMIDRAREVTVTTIKKHCRWRAVAAELGYITGARKSGLRLDADWHVRFHKSRYQGKPCYYIAWSGIEHVFLEAPDIHQNH
ncbi:MAG: hypothetical protein NT159_08235 [Proteobacteria bacterium]|nr:hypothetical protein [Pseudomonadota bacterium]